MIEIDNSAFLSEFRQKFGPLTPSQEQGLTFLISKIAADPDHWPTMQQVAYGLATFKWETGHTFQPVIEHGLTSYFDMYEPGTSRGKSLGNTLKGDGFLFRGRGYVQLTGRDNYTRRGPAVHVDLVMAPDQALVPEIAYQVAASGMRDGWFTGKKLNDFIAPGGQADYFKAREIINGHDRAQDIADIAVRIESVIAAATVATTQAATAG